MQNRNDLNRVLVTGIIALGSIAQPMAFAADAQSNAPADKKLSTQGSTPTVPAAATKAIGASAEKPMTAAEELNEILKTPAAQIGQPSADATESTGTTGKVLLTPGIPLTVNTATEDVQPTDDLELARKQAVAYPDNAEASFILAVALTRTSHVEEALNEVRHARKLADAKGGATYFDKMISSYEKMLEYCPDDNRVRYTLSWAYYMKAYLLMQDARRAARVAAPVTASTPSAAETAVANATEKTPKAKKVNADVASSVLTMIDPKLAQNLPSGKVTTADMPRVKGALEQTPPSAVPQVKKYYEAALKNLDDLLARDPKDIWARAYRAHLRAEYTGDLEAAMTEWRDCLHTAPNNPASYFFLAEGYLKQGNLKESVANITRAIALRGLGN